MEPIYICIFGSFFFPCVNSFSSVARVEILCVDIVFSNQYGILGLPETWNQSWQAVRRHFMFFSGIFSEFYHAVLLWSSGDVLWTAKLYPTFHPHVKWADNDYIYIFRWTYPLMSCLALKHTHNLCNDMYSKPELALPPPPLSYRVSSTIRGQPTDIQIISVSIPSVNTHLWLDQKLPACLAAPREPLGAS